MLNNETENNEEYYSPLDALEEDGETNFDDDTDDFDGDYDDFDGDDTDDFDGDYDDFDGDDADDFDGDYDDFDGDGDEIIDCSGCNHSWDLADSSPNDAYVCHLCGTDNSYVDDESSSFDDSVFNMDFSDVRGDFKQSFGRVNRKIDSNPRRRRRRIRRPRGTTESQLRRRRMLRRKMLRSKRRGINSSESGEFKGGMQSQPRMSSPSLGMQSQPRMARPKRGGMLNSMDKINPSGIAKPVMNPNTNGIAKPVMNPNTKGIAKPASTPSFQSSAAKPSKNNLLKGGLKNKLKKPIKVKLSNDKKVIIKGASNFILSQKSQDESIKSIQYYKGKKLKPLVIIITNNDPTDFNFELFNPSMPLDYLYSTSQNLNNRISIAGSQTSYSDMLFNILANPTMLINAQITTAGTQVANQNNQSIFVKNKNIEGYEKVFPVNVDLQVDNMQVANDIIYFNIFKAINRPFIPDGMDIMQYKVLSGMTVNLTFWYTQVSLKKFFYEEARASKTLL